MMAGGRPAKPTAEHKRDGTLRADRHGQRADGAFPVGEPVRPEDLSGTPLAVWQFIKDNYPPEALSKLDTYALWALSDWWTVYRTLMDTIRDAEMPSYKLQIQAGHAWNCFDKIASRFGLTPADRAKIKVASGGEDEDPLMAMLRARSEN